MTMSKNNTTRTVLIVCIALVWGFFIVFVSTHCSGKRDQEAKKLAVYTAKAEHGCKDVEILEHDTDLGILQLNVCGTERWYKCAITWGEGAACKEIKAKK
jgi:hypothetical protein